MHLIATYPIILFSLVIVLAHPTDVDNPINKLKTHVYGTAEPLNVGYQSDEHSSRPHPSNTQSAPPQGGRKTIVVIITTILLASIAWPLWQCLRHNVQSGTRGHSTHVGGRSEAVSGPILGKGMPSDNLVQHDIKPMPSHRRPATVVSADTAHPIPLPRECILAATPFKRPDDIFGGPAMDPSTLPHEELERFNDYTVADPEIPITPYGNRFQMINAGHHILRVLNWLPINRSKQAVVCISIPPRDRLSLRRSLHKGARDLSEGFPEPRQYLFLLVGVDNLGQKDAENDTKYLRQMFESSPCRSSTRYECIYGPDATYTKIRETALALLDEAQTVSGPSQMFMLFTGTGDGNNAMCLADGKVLSESDLSQWLSTSSINQAKQSTSVLFDICRMAASRLATAFQSVQLAWSCSVGEFAYAIRLSKNKLIPRSIFLLAIFVAAHDMNALKLDGCYFEAAFAFHIKQLSDLILFMYCREHQSRCSRCPPRKRCDPPVAQNPDLQQARGAVTSLGMLIATHFPQHAREVFIAVKNKMRQEEFPGRLCPLSASRAKQSNKPTVKDES
ncbi:unnamed protein product [Rhizoctonia solani]|uniref:Transmembrane protein n=1 Tax=Rhizoctonia solani TaxID=456999 RepID=A0A8H2XJV0_9AGAM|nr:unnamed protein product [Rhizoctonia solani]